MRQKENLVAEVFDARSCSLGEGAFWHPERQAFFWFDILGKRLLSRTDQGAQQWQFDEHVSAAGWIDKQLVLIASETQLFTFNLDTGESQKCMGLEADVLHTRSNDGRADPWGGFWIGTMGKQAEPSAGAIYRFYQGTLSKLYDQISISNAICFAPDRSCAFYCDTPTRLIMRQPLDSEGWPKGAAQTFVDLNAEGLNPDGAVVDQRGFLWNAQWGASRIAVYDPSGTFVRSYGFAASQISCPGFGGPDLNQLYATSAADGLFGEKAAGQTFRLTLHVKGQAEHRLII